MVFIIYALLNFISAVLIFFIQPLTAKTVLPILGGAPFVWTGCMVFFQSVLLAGYVYAHLLNKYLKKKTAIYVHLAVFVVAIIISIPLDITGLKSGVAPGTHQLRWLIISLLKLLGLPFFVIAATSPLTQTWFAETKSEWRKKPFMLYAASNLGSFAGLFSYPLLFEPFLDSGLQAIFVDICFVLVFIFLVTAGVFLHKHPFVAKAKKQKKEIIAVKTKFTWIFFALIPSGLLYGISTYVSTDLVSIPLLWVIPLAIYILTFVLVFAGKGRRFSSFSTIHFALATVMILQSQIYVNAINFILLIHYTALFIFCMTCHQKLYEMRPKTTDQLTIFYIFLSIGGVAGGILSVFVAPNIFNSVLEYPIFIFLSTFIWLDFKKVKIESTFTNTLLLSGIFFCVLIMSYAYFYLSFEQAKTLLVIIVVYLSIIALLLGAKKPLISVLAIGMILLAMNMSGGSNVDYQHRNIFGVSKVNDDLINNSRSFTHGSTSHGIQRIEGQDKLMPTSYYYGLHTYFDKLPPSQQTAPIALIGEGIGTMVCYGHKNQQVDIVEINPDVTKIAEEYFTYMRDCPANKQVYLGDGRIEIGKQPDHKYGIIVIDAFSSDSIPVHLITKEAVALYAKKLTRGGIMFFNISNRYLALTPVLAAIADSLGFNVEVLNFYPGDVSKNKLALPAIWIAIAPEKETIEALKKTDRSWQAIDKVDDKYLWRDDYSNIIRSLVW